MEAKKVSTQDVDLALSKLALFKDKVTRDANFGG